MALEVDAGCLRVFHPSFLVAPHPVNRYLSAAMKLMKDGYSLITGLPADDIDSVVQRCDHVRADETVVARPKTKGGAR